MDSATNAQLTIEREYLAELIEVYTKKIARIDVRLGEKCPHNNVENVMGWFGTAPKCLDCGKTISTDVHSDKSLRDEQEYLAELLEVYRRKITRIDELLNRCTHDSILRYSNWQSYDTEYTCDNCGKRIPVRELPDNASYHN